MDWVKFRKTLADIIYKISIIFLSVYWLNDIWLPADDTAFWFKDIFGKMFPIYVLISFGMYSIIDMFLTNFFKLIKIIAKYME